MEEFEKAYARWQANASDLQIMFYFLDLTDTTAAPEVNSFRDSLRQRGVYYWTYKTVPQFRRAARIHLSRQVQRLARSPRIRTRLSNTLRVPVSQLGTQVGGLLAQGRQESEGVLVACSLITADLRSLTSGITEATNLAKGASRPGFRPRPDKRLQAIKSGTVALEQFTEVLPGNVIRLEESFTSTFDYFGRALTLLAPFGTLQQGLLLPLSDSPKVVRALTEAVEGARNSMSALRHTTASLRKYSDDFSTSRRAAVEAMDRFEETFSSMIRLSRELERTIDEFLDS